MVSQLIKCSPDIPDIGEIRHYGIVDKLLVEQESSACSRTRKSRRDEFGKHVIILIVQHGISSIQQVTRTFRIPGHILRNQMIGRIDIDHIDQSGTRGGEDDEYNE